LAPDSGARWLVSLSRLQVAESGKKTNEYEFSAQYCPLNLPPEAYRLNNKERWCIWRSVSTTAQVFGAPSVVVGWRTDPVFQAPVHRDAHWQMTMDGVLHQMVRCSLSLSLLFSVTSLHSLFYLLSFLYGLSSIRSYSLHSYIHPTFDWTWTRKDR
jgi:hypothetical protein